MSTDGLHARQPAAISSALRVLEEVARLGPGATAMELSSALGLPRATTYRLVNLLVADGYLVRMPNLHGFALGRRVVEFANLIAPVPLPSAAVTVLHEFRSSVRAGVHLVRYEHDAVRVVDADPDFPLADAATLSADLSRSAVGRLLLADRSIRGEDPPRDASAVTAAARDDLDRLGYASQRGSFAPGHGCIAVPIRSDTGTLVGGLALSAPSARVDAPGPLVHRMFAAARDLARTSAW